MLTVFLEKVLHTRPQAILHFISSQTLLYNCLPKTLQCLGQIGSGYSMVEGSLIWGGQIGLRTRTWVRALENLMPFIRCKSTYLDSCPVISEGAESILQSDRGCASLPRGRQDRLGRAPVTGCCRSIAADQPSETGKHHRELID